MLAYEDGEAAMAWLARAFGFKERMRMIDQDNRLAHGELELNGGIVMLASPPDYLSPNSHVEVCEPARKWLAMPWVIDGVVIYVDDVDKHCERAKKAGATILSEPEDTPYGRHYRAADLEGHRWMFLQRTE